MKPRPACLPCILHQALQVARAASEDEWSQRKVLNGVLRGLPEADWNLSPAEILGDTITQARSSLKVSDPYADARGKVQRLFQTMAEEFRQRLAEAEDPFALAAVGAAAANLVDELIFERFARSDPREVFEASVAAGFQLGSADSLRDALVAARSVLYLLDNAGEVSFDALLIEQLQALGKTVRTVVRGGGLLHDVTEGDAVEVGLAPPRQPSPPEPEEPEPADPPPPPPPPEMIVIPNGQLGVPPVAGSSDLRAALEVSDLVIAKGSANYESFSAPDREVIYMLRAKCVPVSQSLGVSVGSLVLLRETPASAE